MAFHCQKTGDNHIGRRYTDKKIPGLTTGKWIRFNMSAVEGQTNKGGWPERERVFCIPILNDEIIFSFLTVRVCPGTKGTKGTKGMESMEGMKGTKGSMEGMEGMKGMEDTRCLLYRANLGNNIIAR